MAPASCAGRSPITSRTIPWWRGSRPPRRTRGVAAPRSSSSKTDVALFPQTFIDDLKTHADIVVVIQDYVSLKKVGAKYKGLCPFHGEKTPSFNVDRDKGFFHCFGCQAGGDVIKFIELHERVGF